MFCLQINVSGEKYSPFELNANMAIQSFTVYFFFCFFFLLLFLQSARCVATVAQRTQIIAMKYPCFQVKLERLCFAKALNQKR